MPSEEVDRNSSMPLIVLTASSILSVICISMSSGAEPGCAGRDRNDREIDLGKAIQPELQVAENAEHHQHQDQHGGEDGTANAKGG